MSEINESRIRQVFDLAMAKPPAERDEFLRRIVGDEGEMLDRVRELLRAHAEEAAPSPAAPSASPSPDPAPSEAEEPGTVIGHYKLLQQIGEGGMGVVWMAEQFEPVRRKVALKIIKLGMDSKQVVARFEAERQALALMDHPNIAKVLDGGMTGGGRPYFVMELVKGVPINEFCDEAKFDIRQRLELFTKVCNAVQHAHQKGIIHRDLKPSNVLVTLHDGTPVPKVIDFGIAKATNQQLTQKTLFTEYQQILGTPEYMAPEQASMSGLDVDTRADVYSLGVLLYELLTGTKPFDLRTILTRGYEELLRTIREEEPPKPSTRASSSGEDTGRISMARQLGEGQLGRALRGDLDWIVVKSMEKDRTRRYETASGLAADIERFLRDEPVLATPPSAAYRARKFVRRHRGPVIAAALVAVALVLGVIGTGVGLVRAQAEARRAERAEKATARELARATEVKGVIKEMLLGITPEEAQGVDTTLLRRIVDETAGRLDRDEIGDERIEAELRVLLGHAYMAIGAYDEAGRHLPRAIALREKALGPEHPETLDARMQLTLLHANRGEAREAARMQEELLPLLERVAGPDHKATIGLMVNLAQSYWNLHRLDEAKELAERALSVASRALGDEDEHTLNAAANLALVYRALGRAEEAAAQYERLVEIRRRRFGPEHPSTLGVMTNLAMIRTEAAEYDEAERILDEARRVQQKVLGEENPRALMTTVSLAQLQLARGRTSEAEELLQKVADVVRRTLSPEHTLSLGTNQMLARVYLLQGRQAEATRIILEATKIARRVLGDQSPRALDYLERSADTMAKVRRFPEAYELYARIREVRRAQLGDEHEKTLLITVKFADTTARLGRREKGEDLLREVRGRLEASYGPKDPRTDFATRTLARVIGARGRWDEAEALYRELLGRREEDSADKAALYEELSDLYLAAGRVDEAESARREQAAILARIHGEKSVHALLVRKSVARLLHARGRLDDAQREYREVVDALRATVGPDHPIVIETECLLAIVYGGARQFAKAEALLLDAQKRAERQWGRRHVLTAETYRSLGMVYMDWGKGGEAERVLKIAVEAQAEAMGTPSFEDLDRLAQIERSRAKVGEAARYYEEAVKAAKATFGEVHPAFLPTLLRQAENLQVQGRLDEAETRYLEARSIADRTLPKTHAHRVQALSGLAALLQARGKLEESVATYEELLEANRRPDGAASPVVLEIMRNLGIARSRLGRYEEAERVYREGIAATKKAMGEKNPMAAGFLVMLGYSYSSQGRWEEAEKAFREANGLFRMFAGPNAIPTQLSAMGIGSTLVRAGRSEDAVALLESCTTSLRRSLPKGHGVAMTVTSVLVECYDALGRKEDAAPLLKEVVAYQTQELAKPGASSGVLINAAERLLFEGYETHDPKQALELARRAHEMAVESKEADAWQALRAMARAQFQTGDRKTAIETIRRALAQAPEGRRPELEKDLAKFEKPGGD